MPNKRLYTDQQLTDAVASAKCWADVMEALGFTRARGAGDVRRVAARIRLDTEHLDRVRKPSAALPLAQHPSVTGAVTEAAILAALVAAGHSILLPFGDGRRYDLAIDEGGKLIRIQCKTATVESGCLCFSAASKQRNGTFLGYEGEADFFGVYAPAIGKVYLVPVADVARFEGRLRLDPVKNNQTSGIRWASDYELQQT